MLTHLLIPNIYGMPTVSQRQIIFPLLSWLEAQGKLVGIRDDRQPEQPLPPHLLHVTPTSVSKGTALPRALPKAHLLTLEGEATSLELLPELRSEAGPGQPPQAWLPVLNRPVKQTRAKGKSDLCDRTTLRRGTETTTDVQVFLLGLDVKFRFK